jgi:hypothetical protein
VFTVTVQLEVPLQVRAVHWSEVQVTVVPPVQAPAEEQVSPKVQALPSSQVAPVFGVTEQVAVPLQVSVLHWSPTQETGMPAHRVPLHVSL